MRDWFFVAAVAAVGCAGGIGDDGSGGQGVGGSGALGGAGGGPPACVDASACASLSDFCHSGECQATGCVAVPSHELGACDDGDPCTAATVCHSGTCGGGDLVDCAPLDDDCHVGLCDPVLGCLATLAMLAHEGVACDDGLACSTGETCQSGACVGTAVTLCANADGCCPAGCTAATDDDCSCGLNLALVATPTISNGGMAPPYLPTEMNNGIGEDACQWTWVADNGVANGAWMQLAWADPVTIGSLYIETANGPNPGPPCNPLPGQNIRSGTVQWWDGAQWITSTSFADEVDDVQLDLPAPVTTTRIRVYDLTAHPGNGNSRIYEWHVYGGTGCAPPP